LIELDSAEAERGHREWWAGRDGDEGDVGEIGRAVNVLSYVFRRVTELMGMKLAG